MLFLVPLVLVSLPVPDPETPGSASFIVINEFMAIPTASATEAEGEWIELYNRSGDYVNLAGWRVENQSGASFTLPTYLLPPGGYYVAGASSNRSRNGDYSPDFVYSGFSISSYGSLTLYGPQGQQVECIAYTAGWPVAAGRSCERVNPGWIGSMASSWASSVESYGDGDLGTPGDRNSVYQNSFADNTWAFIKAFVQ